MKIYIVTSGEYSDYGIRRVFLSREKAQNYVRYHQSPFDEYRVEEYDTFDENYQIRETGFWRCDADFSFGDLGYRSSWISDRVILVHDDESKTEFERRVDGMLCGTLTRCYPESKYDQKTAMQAFEKTVQDNYAKFIALHDGGERLDLLYPCNTTHRK